MGVLQPLSARCAYPYAARSVAASMEALRLPQIAELSLSSIGSGAVVGSSMHTYHRKRQHSKMNTDTVEDLARLKAIAGERQERDSSNNPQIPEGKVPLNSAASKTSSALADYTKGLQAEDESTDRPRTDQLGHVPSSVAGEPTSLKGERELVDTIAAQASLDHARLYILIGDGKGQTN